MRRWLFALIIACACVDRAAARVTHHPYTQPGVVRIGWGSEPVVDPFAYSTAADKQLGRLLYEPLFDVDRFGRLVPRLATVVPTEANGGIRDGGLTIRYTLRSDARFADGKLVTADDVVATVHGAIRSGSSFDEVASFGVDGPHVVAVRLKYRFAPFIARFFTASGDVSYVVEGGASHAGDPAAYVGAGPYRLAEFRRGDRLRFVANPLYYRGAPRLSEIRVLLLPDAHTRQMELRSHDVDAVIGMATADATTAFTSGAGIRMMQAPLPGVIALTYATWKTPFDDAAVRRALDAAIDRRFLADRVQLGTVLPATAFTPPGPWLAAPSHEALLAHDDASNRLFDGAGWRRGPDGVRAKAGPRLELTLALQPAFERVAIALQAMFRAAGVEVTLRSYPLNLYYAPGDQGGIVRSGKFDAAFVGYLNSSEPDLDAQFACAHGRPALLNVSRWCDGGMAAAIAALNGTYDMRTRMTAYDRARARIAESVPVSYLYHPGQFAAFNDDVRGIEFDGSGVFASAYRWEV